MANLVCRFMPTSQNIVVSTCFRTIVEFLQSKQVYFKVSIFIDMSDQIGSVYYILLADKIGKKKERGIVRTTSEYVEVLPGTLLFLTEERFDKQTYILWWILGTLDQENIEIECQPMDTRQLSKSEFALLQPIPDCEERLSILQDQLWLKEGAELQIYDHVTVAVKGQPYLKGIIKYKGELPGVKGIQFGIELLGESKGKGTCDGMIRDRRFFTCEKNCGIFATIRDIRRDQYADRSDRLYQEEQKQIRESGLKEKDRIVWISDNGPEFGEVKWIGILPDSNRMDITVGVEFDNPVGSGTGKYKEHRLFFAKTNHASLVPIMGIMKASVYMEMNQWTGPLNDFIVASNPPCSKKPYQVWNHDKTVGRIISASKLEELQLKAKEKFDISTNVKLVLENGCIIDDEEAFQLLQGSVSAVFCLKEGESLSFAGPSTQSSASGGNSSHRLHLKQHTRNKQTSTTRIPQVPECIICEERFSDTFFIPCGHIACTVCAEELTKRGKQCHICRGIFTSTSKLFF
ncbi:uncharacterized protein LOC128186748 [Crassostrea angulata]|nr:uncharacterized protein LOC128186748 [Crassostrea angulata]